MRIGIRSDLLSKYEDPADFVLGLFSNAEIQQLEQLMPKYEEAIIMAITQGLEVAMNKYNGILLA
jgi:peptidyl-tRNA hydrolase